MIDFYMNNKSPTKGLSQPTISHQVKPTNQPSIETITTNIIIILTMQNYISKK